MGIDTLDRELGSQVQGFAGPRGPRSGTVLVFLAAAAIIFSYIGCYAVTNALVAANMMGEFSPGSDPRPRWMITTFGVLFGVFIVFAGLFRLTNARQMRRIDSIANAE